MKPLTAKKARRITDEYLKGKLPVIPDEVFRHIEEYARHGLNYIDFYDVALEVPTTLIPSFERLGYSINRISRETNKILEIGWKKSNTII